jgi:DNA-binding NarL/FixJ family response regulator
MQVVDDVATKGDALDAVKRLRPDVALVGWLFDGEPIPWFLPALTSWRPPCRLVMLAGHIDRDRVRTLVAAGVTGYLVWRDLVGVAATIHLRTALQGEGLTASPSAVDSVLRCLSSEPDVSSTDEVGRVPG